MPRYDIEVEHHLSGVNTLEWQVYNVEAVYVQALAFTFGVPEDEITITSVETITPTGSSRRALQDTTPSLLVRAIVAFTDHKRFEEYRDILESTKGSQSLNSYFNFLLTDKESQLDNLDVAHMGIQGNFDMVAYFTTVPPTIAPSEQPTPYVDNGGARMNEEAFEGTQLKLDFEGAIHDDVNFHKLLTDILNSESTSVVDTQVVSSALLNGTHSVIVDLDCNFRQCALTWRNETRLAVVQRRVRESNSQYSEFEIQSSKVSILEDGEMEVIEITKENDVYLLLTLGFAVVLSCVLCWKYWKLCFFNKNLEDIDVKEYVNEIIAVEHNNALASCVSLSSVYASDTEMHSEFEGCETLQVFAERERDFAQPAPVNHDVEGFAPTVPMFDDPKRMAGESENPVHHRRRSTQEEADIYDSPAIKRVPSYQKKKLATFGTGLSESDTDITLYGDQETIFQSDEENVLATCWSPRTKGAHASMWE